MENEKVFKFNGTDFSVWKAQMEAYLVAKDLGEVITRVRRSSTITKIANPKITKAIQKIRRIVHPTSVLDATSPATLSKNAQKLKQKLLKRWLLQQSPTSVVRHVCRQKDGFSTRVLPST